MTNGTIKIILIEDHAIVRKAIRLLIEHVPQIEIIAEADNGNLAYELTKQHKPDLLISDINLPGMSGLDLAAKLKDENIKSNILFLTMHQEEEYIIRAFQLNAMGYLHKGVEEEEILEAITDIANGEKHYNKKIAEILTKALLNNNHKSENKISLTSRETEILNLLCKGQSNKMIASDLHISIRTVDTHRSNVMKKLNVSNIAELVAKAIKEDLI